MTSKLSFPVLLGPVLLGVAGIAILLALGIWQVERLEWKRGVLSAMDTTLAADPVALPSAPDPEVDNYRAVFLAGQPTGRELHVLSSGTTAGTGYRVISDFVTEEGRHVLLDLGVMPIEAKATAPETRPAEIIGNLIWPDDGVDASPPPDDGAGIWFARDVAAMAQALGTEPVMVVARRVSVPDRRVSLVPVDSSGIRNDHLEYAITWFLLALVWAAMSGYLIVRTIRQKD